MNMVMPDALLPHRLSRRALLRSAVAGGSGLAAAYLLACSDGDGDAGPGATDQPGDGEQVRFRWAPLTPPAPLPPRRRDHSMVTDGASVFVFGGQSNAPLGDLWVYSIQASTWTNATIEGGPGARFGHNAVWDANRGRMIVFGGQAGGSVFFNDVWEYAPGEGRWFQAKVGTESPSPAPRYGAAGAIDTAGTFVVSHGFTDEGRFSDSWRYDPAAATWADITPADTEEKPIERCLMRGVWDTVRNRLLMYGGQTTDTPFLDDLWALASTGWQQLPRSPNPDARNLYAMVFDDRRKRAILIGGRTPAGQMNDVWLFDATDEFWTPATVRTSRPSPRYGHDAVWVAETSTILLFGGNDGTEDLNDIWQLTPPAEDLEPIGPTPTP
jgi:hypothetical protein